MLRKKLLTIACVVGILACGACFLPPIDTPPHPVAPPRLREELRGIKAIHVVVEDVSGAHTLEPSELAACLTNILDIRAERTHIVTENRETPQRGDAVLRINLIKVTTISNPGAEDTARLWLLGLTVTATLTDANGKTIWQQKNLPYDFRFAFLSSDPAAVWKGPQVRAWLAYGVSDNVLDAMLYGN